MEEQHQQSWRNKHDWLLVLDQSEPETAQTEPCSQFRYLCFHLCKYSVAHMLNTWWQILLYFLLCLEGLFFCFSCFNILKWNALVFLCDKKKICCFLQRWKDNESHTIAWRQNSHSDWAPSVALQKHHVESSALHGSMLLPLCYLRPLCLNVPDCNINSGTISPTIWKYTTGFSNLINITKYLFIGLLWRVSLQKCIALTWWNKIGHLISQFTRSRSHNDEKKICMDLYPWSVLCWFDCSSTVSATSGTLPDVLGWCAVLPC